MLISKDGSVEQMFDVLQSIMDRLSNPGWADAFCKDGLTRGFNVSEFVGTEFDGLERIASFPELTDIQEKVLAELRAIEPRFDLAVVTMARDEALNLAEWIAHTLEIGAQHIFVYTNDNRDGTDELLNWFKSHEPVSVISTTSAPSINIQRKNYQHALYMLPELYLFKWVLLIDVDEFLVLSNKDKLQEFLKDAPEDAGAVLFPWKWRLWQPQLERENGLLCERFPHVIDHTLFKSVLRMHSTASLVTVHHPVLRDGWKNYDSNFCEVADDAIWSKEPKSSYGGWLDHYWGRSFEEFLIKKARGDSLAIPGGQFKRDFSNYFFWTEKLTPENYRPVDHKTISRIKNRVNQYERDISYRVLKQSAEDKYQNARNEFAEQGDLGALFRSVSLEFTAGVTSNSQATQPFAPNNDIRIGAYQITHYIIDPNDVVVVFAAAGKDALGEPIEEFKQTLTRFKKSMIFVRETSPTWFVRNEVPEVFACVADFAMRYKNICVLGESAGASGALVFSKYCPTVSRILALSPQYSVASPFILFDSRFAEIGRAYPSQRFWTFVPFCEREKVHILFGNCEWLDSVHAAMFKLEGYSVHFVDGAGHLVARHLENSNMGDALSVLLERFLNTRVSFDINNIIEKLLSDQPISQAFGFAAISARRMSSASDITQTLPPPSGYANLCVGATTNQSSISEWSVGRSTEEDSAGAVSEVANGPFGFHTDIEDSPWWSVDLGSEKSVTELRIYNRIDIPDCAIRGLRFVIEVGSDEGWKEIFRKNDSAMFGGRDGNPFVLTPKTSVIARHLRLRLLERNYLHYEKIEIFGAEA